MDAFTMRPVRMRLIKTNNKEYIIMILDLLVIALSIIIRAGLFLATVVTSAIKSFIQGFIGIFLLIFIPLRLLCERMICRSDIDINNNVINIK